MVMSAGLAEPDVPTKYPVQKPASFGTSAGLTGVKVTAAVVQPPNDRATRTVVATSQRPSRRTGRDLREHLVEDGRQLPHDRFGREHVVDLAGQRRARRARDVPQMPVVL